MIKFYLANDCKHPGYRQQAGITGPDGGPVPAEHTVGILPDNGRDPLRGTQEQTASTRGG